MLRKSLSYFTVLLVVSCIGSVAQAQDDTIKRTVLNKTEFPGDRYATVQAMVEIKAAAMVARHTHPGVESGYVVEGGGDLLVAGKPPMHLKAGDSFQNPAGTPHSFKNGDKMTKIVATFVVEKDKPLASPAPE
jgi:quercetin dioxygenase-like cupin family protein